MGDNLAGRRATPPVWQSGTAGRLTVVCLLLLMYGLALHSLALKSPTLDEQGFLVRGLAYVRGANTWLRVGHPLGLNALNALPLAADQTVVLPADDPSWHGTSFHRPAELFLWERGNDVAHVMFLGRLPTLWLTLLLAAVVARFAAEMAPQAVDKRSAALLALGLLALDPNILAHSRLITTDLGLTAGTMLAVYTLWRALKWPGWLNLSLAGAGLGLLLNTKFTAGLLLPGLALTIVVGLAQQWRADGRVPWGRLAGWLLVYPAAAGLTLWAGNGFQVGPWPAGLPGFAAHLAGRPMPLAAYLDQLVDIGGRLEKATPAFLFGRYSDQGWWYYFPVAFILKTPLPTLVLLVWALLAGLRRPTWPRQRPPIDWLSVTALAAPSLTFFAFSLTSHVNLGYRHILLLVPFIALGISYRLAGLWSRRARSGTVVSLALIWLTTSTLRIAPDFLAYFNLLGGGPDNGWRALVDSNLDWGQDLGRLADWLAEEGVGQVWLSYFGEARPAYYGINYIGLPSYPPRLMNPDAQPTSLREPAPGVYAISATNLQGVLFNDHDLFAWFRARPPSAKIGYSIFIYEVAATGPPVALSLGGLGIEALAEADWSRFGSNDLRLHWFDPTQSLLLPQAGWLALADSAEIAPELAPRLAQAYQQVERRAGYSLWQRLATTAVPLDPARLSAPVRFTNPTGQIQLLQAELTTAADQLRLLTVWQQDDAPQPTKIFVHLRNLQGSIVAQWDGLGAAWEGWRSGAVLWQVAPLPRPSDGAYDLWIGLYEPIGGGRWLADGSDQLYLGQVTLP